MVGYVLEFKRNYSPATDPVPQVTTPIGEVSSSHVNDHAQNGRISTNDEPKDDLESAATQIPTPRISENFLALVNDITNRRCQEWTMDFVRHLVKLGYLDETAIEIVQARRDPPSFGVGLKPTAER
ncbi:hypothetical protein B0O99DRAFT_683181 [Bisporella sp. PMI_857]|nr:hypothetical protein B0O99DRAFT_683181 [Bisporella sp. PMI_857]